MRLQEKGYQAHKTLECFDNPHPALVYDIRHHCTEFTCLCPVTGQPDFATFEVWFQPAHKCVESKSLKEYLGSFRDERAFHEKVTGDIFQALWTAMQPRFLHLTGHFRVRGGIHSDVVFERSDAAAKR